MRNVWVWASGCALCLIAATTATEPPVKRVVPNPRVKEVTYCTNGTCIQGVVDKVDEDGIVLVEHHERWETVREHQFKPIDLLRESEVLPGVDARFAYRWKDVKRGDTIEVTVKQDHLDKEWYVLEISILRRPKATLPESQKPKEDRSSYLWLRIANDIDNGEDVSDEDILKACPPRPAKVIGSETVTPAHPGGLTKDWQVKLDAIRAKKNEKDKDLKASPPDKK
jgi:hypothetical protein